MRILNSMPGAPRKAKAKIVRTVRPTFECSKCSKQNVFDGSELDGHERFCRFCGASLGLLGQRFRLDALPMCDQNCVRCERTACVNPKGRWFSYSTTIEQIG